MDKILIWGAMPMEKDGGAIVTYYQLREMNLISPELDIHVAPKVWSDAQPTLLPLAYWHKVKTKYFGQIPNEIPKIMKKYDIPLLILWHVPWEYFPIVDKVHKIGGRVLNWQTIHWANDVLFMSDKLHDFDWWVPPTYYAKDTLMKVAGLDGNKMTVIHHGVDLYKFTEHPFSHPKSRAYRKYLDVKDDQKIILFVGRCQMTKGIVQMMLAARKLCSDFNCHVVFKAGVYGGVSRAREISHLLSKMAKWDSRIHFLSEWTSPSEMENITAQSDILVCPSGHEGFSLPPLEAMACFPPNTKVYSPTSILRYYRRYYNGNIFEIETETGIKIQCTPEHPFLTREGWRQAKDLNITTGIYTLGETSSEVEQRRIGDVVENISKEHSKRTDEIITKKKLLGNPQESSKFTDKKEGQRCLQTIQNKPFNKNQNFIFGWNNRCRWNNNVLQKKKRKNNNTNNSSLKYQNKVNRMVGKPSSSLLHLNHKKGESSSPIHICHSRKKDSIFATSNTTLLNNQKRTLQNINKFYPISLRERIRRNILRGRMANVLSNSGFEQEVISSIKIQKYVGNVYNLGTISESYFANSTLVHNCGKPVAITDIPVHRELLGGQNGKCGLLMHPSEHTEYVNDVQSVIVPSKDMIYGTLKYILENPDEAKAMGENASIRVKKHYGLEKVCKQWLALLTKLG